MLPSNVYISFQPMDVLPLSQSCFRISFYYLHVLLLFVFNVFKIIKKSFELHIIHMNIILDLYAKIDILYTWSEILFPIPSSRTFCCGDKSSKKRRPGPEGFLLFGVGEVILEIFRKLLPGGL